MQIRPNLCIESLGPRNLCLSYYGLLPSPDQGILARRPVAAALFGAVIVASIEAIGVSGLNLGLVNPMCIAFLYARGAVAVGNLGLVCLRIAPLYSAEKTLVLEHHSSTPEDSPVARTGLTLRANPARHSHITLSARKCKQSGAGQAPRGCLKSRKSVEIVARYPFSRQ